MRPSTRRLEALIASALLAVVALGGCNLFEPATPESPKGGSVVVGNYSKPDSCLAYMSAGIASKDNTGQELYLGALADSAGGDGVNFHAFFDAVVWSAYDGVKPSDWDYDHERQFFGTLVSLFPDTYELAWTRDEYHPVDEDNGSVQTLHRRYVLRDIRSSVGDTLIVATGYADLTFQYVSTRWALTRWQDRLDLNIGFNPDTMTMGGRRLNARIGG